jgi:hypothetical protein
MKQWEREKNKNNNLHFKILRKVFVRLRVGRFKIN